MLMLARGENQRDSAARGRPQSQIAESSLFACEIERYGFEANPARNLE